MVKLPPINTKHNIFGYHTAKLASSYWESVANKDYADVYRASDMVDGGHNLKTSSPDWSTPHVSYNTSSEPAGMRSEDLCEPAWLYNKPVYTSQGTQEPETPVKVHQESTSYPRNFKPLPRSNHNHSQLSGSKQAGSPSGIDRTTTTQHGPDSSYPSSDSLKQPQYSSYSPRHHMEDNDAYSRQENINPEDYHSGSYHNQEEYTPRRPNSRDGYDDKQQYSSRYSDNVDYDQVSPTPSMKDPYYMSQPNQYRYFKPKFDIRDRYVSEAREKYKAMRSNRPHIKNQWKQVIGIVPSTEFDEAEGEDRLLPATRKHDTGRMASNHMLLYGRKKKQGILPKDSEVMPYEPDITMTTPPRVQNRKKLLKGPKDTLNIQGDLWPEDSPRDGWRNQRRRLAGPADSLPVYNATSSDQHDSNGGEAQSDNLQMRRTNVLRSSQNTNVSQIIFG